MAVTIYNQRTNFADAQEKGQLMVWCVVSKKVDSPILLFTCSERGYLRNFDIFGPIFSSLSNPSLDYKVEYEYVTVLNAMVRHHGLHPTAQWSTRSPISTSQPTPSQFRPTKKPHLRAQVQHSPTPDRRGSPMMQSGKAFSGKVLMMEGRGRTPDSVDTNLQPWSRREPVSSSCPRPVADHLGRQRKDYGGR